MNVTLVKLPLTFASWKRTRANDFTNPPPLGLLSCAGSIREQVDRVRIVDISVGDVFNEKVILDTDILGVGATTRDFPRAIRLLQKAKEVNPKITTVIGGVHVSLQPEDVNHKGIDHFVVGEGEVSLSKIVRGEVKSKVVREPPIKDLDDLPFPAYDLVDVSKYHFFHLNNLYTLETSRGCSFNCSFCSEKKLYGAGYRMKSKERVIEELQLFKPRFTFFSDSNFVGNVKRTIELCNEMINVGVNNRGIYMGHARVDTIVKHPELVKKMADAGFFAIWTGIESPLEESLNVYRKGVTWEQSKKAKKILDDYDIILVAELVIGALDETEEDIKEYTRLIRSIDPDLFVLSILTPMPGSDIAEEIDDLIFIRDLEYYDHVCCVFQHPNIDFKRLNQLHFEIDIRLFYDPITMARRLRKLLRFYLKKQKIVNSILDFKGLCKTVLWDIPKLYFWDSNKYVRDTNKLFMKKLKEYRNK